MNQPSTSVRRTLLHEDLRAEVPSSEGITQDFAGLRNFLAAEGTPAVMELGMKFS